MSKLKKDGLVRVWYKRHNQDSANPDKFDMYRVKEFKTREDSYAWYIENRKAITAVIVTSCSEEFEVNFK